MFLIMQYFDVRYSSELFVIWSYCLNGLESIEELD